MCIRDRYIFDEVKKYSAIDPAMPIPLEKLAWMQNLLIKTGNLTQAVDIKTLVDEGPRAKALALVRK